MNLTLLLSFAGLCLLLAITPGPDSFLVLRYSIGGVRPGIAAAIGSSVGGLVWAVVVAAGLAALLEQSASAYRTIKLIGGVYLLYLGVRALLAHRKKAKESAPVVPVAASIRSAALAGMLSTMFNPKVGLFYLAVVPQFLTEVTFGSTMTLGAIECVVAGAFLIVLAFAASRAVEILRRPKVTQRLDRISAGVLAALGIGTVASAV
ncbi:LysE family translocator [Antrihabitans cavernicola]|uniref:LysE family translocator n=1 Tax=Antrihabitans cavernicola TaxID=2495913 RepID=A0A5A7SG48_9NOCA|nr:LysE family translocator [Spelaeibacter cavernicola]KAA0024419.1 LysE family translocator [Spelaeibacter cavernicola]